MRGVYAPQLGARPRIHKLGYEHVSEDRQVAICNDYGSEMTLREVLAKHRVHHTLLYKILDERGVERRADRSEVDEFNWRESRLIDSIRNGVTLHTAAYLAQMSESAAATVVARAKLACRL